MAFTVAKPFLTPTRRFRIGDTVAGSGLDGPVALATWCERGFLTWPMGAGPAGAETMEADPVPDAPPPPVPFTPPE